MDIKENIVESQEYRRQRRTAQETEERGQRRPATEGTRERRRRPIDGEDRRPRGNMNVSQTAEDVNREANLARQDAEYLERRRQRLERRQVMRERARKRRRIRNAIIALMILTVVGAVGALVMLIGSENFAENGALLFQEQDYEGAIIEFEKAIEERENLADAYLGIALANWELGIYDELESMFNLAYANGAEMTGSSRNMLAILELEAGDYVEALEFIEQGLALEGNSDELTQEFLRNEIVCYEQMGDWETAEAKMAEYLILYPDDAEAVTDAQFLETR